MEERHQAERWKFPQNYYYKSQKQKREEEIQELDKGRIKLQNLIESGTKKKLEAKPKTNI